MTFKRNKKGRPTKSEEYQVLERRMHVAKLYCQCKTLLEISEEIGASVVSVSKDLKAIREFWLSHIAQSFDERMADILGRIDHVEAEAWLGWQRSCKDAEILKTTTEKGIRISPAKAKGKPPTSKLVPVKENLEKVVKGQAGDPRFLSVIMDCIDRRSKILKVTEDQPINQVYLNFNSLLPPREEVKPVDQIEHKIAQVLEGKSVEDIIEHQSPQQSSTSEMTEAKPLPNGLKEIPNGNGENH